MRHFLTIILAGTCLCYDTHSQTIDLSSPNGKLNVIVEVGDDITFSVNRDGYRLIDPSRVSMELEGGVWLGKNARLMDRQERSVKETITPVVPEKSAVVDDIFREVRIRFEENFALVFRAYDEGVAYRFETTREGDVIVASEQGTYNFSHDWSIYFPEETSFFSHSERLYKRLRLSEISDSMMACVPVLIEADQGVWLAVMESDLEDYPGMYVSGNRQSPTALSLLFPHYPLKVEQRSDRDVPVIERAEYIARTAGTRTFPWRVIMVAGSDKELIANQLVYKLAPSLRIENPSWIKPGKVAWDWWNWNNVYNVEFPAGVNTSTYKHYIDFAARHGIEYVILDEGWYKLGDLLTLNPDIDMEEIVAHAKRKGVGIILWVIWKTLDDQFDEAFDQFERWGVKGLKVDFMQRDDQPMVNYYYKVAAEAARRKMVVDFHGAYKPAGLRRAYPNVLTREGVRGLEHSKWSADITPDHDLIIPFTRMLAGPMDFTPGAMRNAAKGDFASLFRTPMSQGTRCHQLAMYVVYESPLQMLADSPSNYEREKECLEFLSAVPTVWDETTVVDASVGNYVVVARRRGSEWYVGAMSSWTGCTLTIPLSFLSERPYDADIYEDGVNAHRNGNDYRRVRLSVSGGDTLRVRLAPGGGWVARIR